VPVVRKQLAFTEMPIVRKQLAQSRLPARSRRPLWADKESAARVCSSADDGEAADLRGPRGRGVEASGRGGGDDLQRHVL